MYVSRSAIPCAASLRVLLVLLSLTAPNARAANSPAGSVPVLSSSAPGPSDSSAVSSTAPDDLRQLIVSATRSPEPIDRTGSSVSVISASQLETQQTLFVSSALSQLPGITVSRSGGPGQITELYLRGADPGESIVLIDGIRLNDPSTPDGEPLLGDLLVNDIARVEVLRGPQSTLYGSDAIGGVIDILTRRGATRAFEARFSAEGGSFGTYRLNGATDGTVGALQYGAAVNYYDTAGTPAAASLIDQAPDAYRNLGATGNVRLHLTTALSVDLRGFYTRSHSGIPGYPPPSYALQSTPEFSRDLLRAGYAAMNGVWLGGRLRQRLALVGSDSDRRFYGSYVPSAYDPSSLQPVAWTFVPAENFYAQGGASRLEYQGVLDMPGASQLSYGAETGLTTLVSDSLPDPADTPVTGRDRRTGYYLQWQSTLAGSLTLTAGARADHDQRFGEHASVKLAAAWRLAHGATVLHADYGTGFKAPTLYQLFSPYSDPLGALRPETAAGWEFGADQLLANRRVRLSATYFRRQERRQVDFEECLSTSAPGCAARPFGYYYNIGRARADGFEAELAARPLDSLSLWLNYTALSAVNELNGLQLARRPHASGNLGLTWTPRAGATLGASLSYIGARYDNAADTMPLAGDMSVALFASYPLGATLQAFARIDNLFDVRHQPVAGYRRPGRAFYAGLRAQL